VLDDLQWLLVTFWIIKRRQQDINVSRLRNDGVKHVAENIIPFIFHLHFCRQTLETSASSLLKILPEQFCHGETLLDYVGWALLETWKRSIYILKE
jgi:hypothetical protein